MRDEVNRQLPLERVRGSALCFAQTPGDPGRARDPIMIPSEPMDRIRNETLMSKIHGKEFLTLKHTQSVAPKTRIDDILTHSGRPEVSQTKEACLPLDDVMVKLERQEALAVLLSEGMRPPTYFCK